MDFEQEQEQDLLAVAIDKWSQRELLPIDISKKRMNPEVIIMSKPIVLDEKLLVPVNSGQ